MTRSSPPTAANPDLRRCGGESGSGGTSLTTILVMPAVVLLIFGGIQFGLHSYARSLALSAAQAGVRAATQAPASTGRGYDAAKSFADVKAAGTLLGAVVTVDQTGDVITVTVTAEAPSLIPLMHPAVSQQASARIETLP